MRRRTQILTMVASLATLATLAQPATANQLADRSNTRIARFNPQLSEELLNSLPTSVLDEEIWIDPAIPPGTPFVVAAPDGTLSVAAGQSAAQTEAARASVDTAGAYTAACQTSAIIPTLAKGVIVKSQCAAILGSADNTKVRYTVKKHPVSKGDVSWAGWGYKRTCTKYNLPPRLPGCSQWSDAGGWYTGWVGSSSAVTPWGKVGAVPKMKFNNTSLLLGWSGVFAATIASS